MSDDLPGAHIHLGPIGRARIRFRHRRLLGRDEYDTAVTFDEIVESNLWRFPDDVDEVDDRV